MDDSFDEIDIPDNWLELGSKRRNEDTDFIVDKKFKSDLLQEPSWTEIPTRDEIGIHLNNQTIESDLTDEVNSVIPVPQVEKTELDKNSATTSSRSSSSYSYGKPADCEEVKIHNDTPPLVSSSPFSDTYEDWSLNEPEFYDNSPNQFLLNEDQNTAHQALEIKSPPKGFESSASSASETTLKVHSLDDPAPPKGFENGIESSALSASETTLKVHSLNDPAPPKGFESSAASASETTLKVHSLNDPAPPKGFERSAPSTPVTTLEVDSFNDPNPQNGFESSAPSTSISKLNDHSLNDPAAPNGFESSAPSVSVTVLYDSINDQALLHRPNCVVKSEDVKIQPSVTRAADSVKLYTKSDHTNSIAIEEGKVENYVEHLSFTDDELRFISSEPGDVITVDSDNLPVQSSSKQEMQPNLPLGGQSSKPDLKKISSLVRDAQIISGIVPDRDFNDIYNTLLDHRDNENRLDIATVQLLERPPASDKTVTVDLFEEVQMVMSAVPQADANVVYTLLESLPPSMQRVKQVIHHLNPALALEDAKSSKKKPLLIKKESSVDDPLLKNDPLFRDMRTIARIFPETDRNEIYALLEANHDKTNRLQAVIDEIGKLRQEESQEIVIAEEDDSFKLSEEDILEQDIETMKKIFPDCDPNFLYEKLESMKNEANRTDLLASDLFENKDYPKIKDLVEKTKAKEKEQEEFARLEKVRKLDLTVDEFYAKFPDPEKTFGDESTSKSTLYQDHAYSALRNEFRMLKAGYLKVTLIKHSSHFYPTYRQIANEVLSIPLDQRHKFMNKFMKHPRSYKVQMPVKADEYFYHEYWFVLNEQKIKDDIKQKEEAKQKKIEEAKAKGELFECGCCYDDECLFEDLTSCPEGHLFCKTCVIRSTEAAFGEMKTKFPCLADCDQNIPLSVLQTVIPANLFSKIVQRMQEEEILQADIPDLVSCPFCPFATIMPNPDDKVFKCLNPECLKESCRCADTDPNLIHKRDMEAAAKKAKEDYLEMHPESATLELKTDVDDMIKGYVSSSQDIKNIPMIGPGGYLGREYGGNW
ncbi:E3 ubiquitin-protein ligase [Elysia marginata]|uniref:E3 ubiquitin-protein ligase n=1 Tax=Elysia marginata TaxID=1093978 RepID=A0AAV4GPB9_9GAST|nr:E3 ubiquitin-protein ligase [Elysia marginata]